MMKRKLLLLLCLLASGAFLVACNPKSHSSSDRTNVTSSANDGSPSTKGKFHKNRRPDDLPVDADSAKKDKIYATDGSEIYYEGSSSGLTASAPDYKGYTADTVKQILGDPDSIINDRSQMVIALKQDEPKRIINLFKNKDITREEARAFNWKAVDFALGNLRNYYIYEYKEKDIILLFNAGSNTLVYVTPNPTYVYWR